MSVYLDKDHNIQDIDANIIPTPDIDTTPLVTKEEAAEIVIADYRDFFLHERGQDIPEERVSKYKSKLPSTTKLYIYNSKLIYNMRIGFFEYILNAKTGKIIRRDSTIVE
jgi:hypothetical protein